MQVSREGPERAHRIGIAVRRHGHRNLCRSNINARGIVAYPQRFQVAFFHLAVARLRLCRVLRPGLSASSFCFSWVRLLSIFVSHACPPSLDNGPGVAVTEVSQTGSHSEFSELR